MSNIEPIAWFKNERIPPGTWMFLSTIRNGLAFLKSDRLKPTVDLTEGLDGITITGRLEAYRQVSVRRALDLSQATITTWNAGFSIGSVVCARALLETLAAFHDLMAEVCSATGRKDWKEVSRVVDAYALSTSEGPKRTTGKAGAPPTIGKQVTRFIEAIEPDAVQFWHQISDISHPNGKPMLHHFAVFSDNLMAERATSESEPELFRAVHNCLYSICWFTTAMAEFDQLLDKIRYCDEVSAGDDSRRF